MAQVDNGAAQTIGVRKHVLKASDKTFDTGGKVKNQKIDVISGNTEAASRDTSLGP
jgi:hypothetical protein